MNFAGFETYRRPISAILVILVRDNRVQPIVPAAKLDHYQDLVIGVATDRFLRLRRRTAEDRWHAGAQRQQCGGT